MADFERIFTENRDFIYKYLLKLSRDSSVAEELTQETFFRGYVNIASLRDEAKVSTWLCSIAKNAYFSHRRRERRLLPGDQDPAVFDYPEADMEKRELVQRAHRALHALPEPYREVFSLRTFAELSYAQIAALFGKSEVWGRVTCYRAKLMLQEAMEEEEENE